MHAALGTDTSYDVLCMVVSGTSIGSVVVQDPDIPRASTPKWLLEHLDQSGLAPTLPLCRAGGAVTGHGSAALSLRGARTALRDTCGLRLGTLICQNEVVPLFGDTRQQWRESNAKDLLQKLVKLWNTW